MDLCQTEKFAGRERYKDNQACFKVVWCKGRKSDVGILGRDVVEENFVDVTSLATNSLPEMTTWLGTHRNWIVFRETESWKT